MFLFSNDVFLKNISLIYIIEKHSEVSVRADGCNKLFKVDLDEPWNCLWYCYQKSLPPALTLFWRIRVAMPSSVATTKFWEAPNIFAFKWARVFGVGHRLFKHKTTGNAKLFGEAWPYWQPLATPTVIPPSRPRPPASLKSLWCDTSWQSPQL